MRRIIAILVLSILLLPSVAMLSAADGGKGKIKDNFVFIQTGIADQYENDRDVTWQVRCQAYRNGIPLDTTIKLYIYDSNGQYLLDTESPNPMTVYPGEIATVNMGLCEVGLYRAKLLAKSGDLQGTLTAQWVVMYPPYNYYFAWRGETSSMHGTGTVKAEFRSQETYKVKIFNETTNRTETIEKKRGFDVIFYTYESGGKHIIRQFTNVTSINETFREIYQTGIYCDVKDEHGWVNAENRDPWTGRTMPYHWLGSRKWQASPKWTTEQVIVAVIAIAGIMLIATQSSLMEYMDNRKKRKLEEYRKHGPFGGGD